ncbi:MAG: U32 family peptidase, partial [Desulfobulbaceae bacterium]|nr:U32 family peptidase [Desulfobulbaceae bacterium]
MANSMNQTELLAPAGGLESFFAAIEAGADAVYCGLNDFSARAKAKNFTLAEVAGLTAYSHQHDRKLYVALNTLVKELELPHLVETLAALEEIGIDGVILQDLGVWRLIRDHFPGLALHASTQMTVHNVAGVKMLERMGFERAVLARELSVQEIGVIRQQTSIELEHFIHGALCFGISGQCLFSSYLNGTSGNRGRCAQPCRRRYLYHEQPGYYFSTNDFCAIEFLPQLIKAGVMSFKIEGRMKSAEYVGKVVEAYRLMLDAPPARRKEVL